MSSGGTWFLFICWGALRGKIDFWGGKNLKIAKMADFCHFSGGGLEDRASAWGTNAHFPLDAATEYVKTFIVLKWLFLNNVQVCRKWPELCQPAADLSKVVHANHHAQIGYWWDSFGRSFKTNKQGNPTLQISHIFIKSC